MVASCDHAVAVRAGEELDLARLSAYLGRHFDGPGPVTVEQFPSGHSNLTYRVTWGGRELVLRRPPFGSQVKSAHDMGREYRVLSKLHESYNVAPKVILYCEDLAVLDAPFYLMEPMRGIILRRELPPGMRLSPATARQLSESFLDNLVRLHSLDYEHIGLGDLGKPHGYLERQVKGWIERYHHSATHDLSEVERVSTWLTENIPASRDATLIHNDYKYDNVVLDSDDITTIVGVLDWEMCTLGDPLTDLGTTLAYWVDATDPEELQKNRWGPTNVPGSLMRAEIVHDYARKTGTDPSQIEFYLTFARFKLAVIVQQIFYRYHQGLTKDERFASMPDTIQMLLRASLHSAQTGRI